MPARSRRDRQATVGKADPLELALEEADDNGAGREAAYSLLDRQAKLVSWQIASEQLGVALKLLGGLIGLVAAILLGAMVLNAARSQAVVVQALETPPVLTETGLSGRVVAGKLQDGLALIQATTRTTAKGRSIANAWTGDIAVEVAETGVSIGEIDRLLRERLGRNTYVSGELVDIAEGRVALTVRGGAILARTFTGPLDSVDDLTRQAAEYVYGEAEPYLFTSYLNQNGRSAEVISFAQNALTSADSTERAPLANAIGIAHSNMGSSDLGIQWYRLAIQYEPTYWRSWGNLVGELLKPGTEEEAYRAAQKMIEADASSTTSRAPKDDLTNVYLLTQDWTAYVVGTMEDAALTGGVGTLTSITANPSIAEGEARRHDWAAAARYMGLADPSDVLVAPTGMLIAGYQAIDENRFSDAVRPLEQFNAIWLANSDLAFAFHEGPCYLALAYDRTGERAKARRIYDQMGALVVCHAFEADGVEATGDRAAADAAYRRAITLAPSIPFAYHRRALAMLQRGEFKVAAGRFRDAHQRGPNWADPLKGWGDALAAQGLWALAIEKYELAEPLAPNWRELHLAHALALDRAGRSRDAAAVRQKIEA